MRLHQLLQVLICWGPLEWPSNPHVERQIFAFVLDLLIITHIVTEISYGRGY